MNDLVRVRNPVGGFKLELMKWVPGVVSEVCESQWYLVQVDNLTRHFHADRLITALDIQRGSIN